MSTEYRTDERAIRDFIRKNVKPTDPDQIISLTIYYRTPKQPTYLSKTVKHHHMHLYCKTMSSTTARTLLRTVDLIHTSG